MKKTMINLLDLKLSRVQMKNILGGFGQRWLCENSLGRAGFVSNETQAAAWVERWGNQINAQAWCYLQ